MKSFFASLLLLSLFAGCKKDDDCNFDPCLPKAPAAETAQVEAYLSANSITGASLHCSGMYYKVISQGSGTAPTPCNNISIYYKGRLTNGAGFDSTTTSPAFFPLSNLIKGWQNGLPYVKPGGKIQLFIPPSLGYGDRSAGTVPANSILIFDIELVAVQ